MHSYQVLGRDARDVGFGGRGGAVLEIPLADLEPGVAFILLGAALSFAFASNIEATAATDTDRCTSSSLALCKLPSFKLLGISTCSKLVEELSASLGDTVSEAFRTSGTGRPPGSFTGQARTTELDIGVGSMGTARLDRYNSSSDELAELS
jgi:hypothetical protein